MDRLGVYVGGLPNCFEDFAWSVREVCTLDPRVRLG